MKKRLISIEALTVFVMFVAAPSFANGLLGNQYSGFEIGLRTHGDDDNKDIGDSVFCVLDFNVPMGKHVDGRIKLAGGDLVQDEIDNSSMEALCGINYLFTPDRNVNPYVGFMVGFVNTEEETDVHGYRSSEDENDLGFSMGGNDFAFSFGGGIEVNISDKSALRPSIAYKKIGDEDDVAAGLSLNMWFKKSFFGRLTTSYTIDHGDFFYAAGLGFKF